MGMGVAGGKRGAYIFAIYAVVCTLTNTFFFVGVNLGNIEIELTADDLHTIGAHDEVDGEYTRRMMHRSPCQDSRKVAN